MMALIRTAVAKPVLANMIMVALFLGGIFAVMILPQEEMPNVSFPWVFVYVVDNGISPEEIEKTITIPLEEELQNLDDLNSMISNSREGGAFVWLKFDTMPDDEFQRRIQDVRSEVQKVDLPSRAEDADISQFKTQDFAPVLRVIIQGEIPEHELKQLAEDLRDDILDVENVSQVQITGVREREVWVEVDPARLERYGVTLDMVAKSIRNKHLNLTGGDLETGNIDYRVRTMGEAGTIQELERVIVRATPGGGHVRVSDVASVANTFEDEVSRSRFNGRPAATLTITKTDDGNSIKIIDAVKRLAASYQEERLPVGAEINFTNDSSKYIHDVLGTLKSNAWIGMLLVAVSLFLFLGFHQALFAVIGIPVALATTFLFLYITNNTINGSTLFALVLVLGMLVDDAIVVIENCYRYIQAGMKPGRAAVVGAQEVMAPVLTSAATTMAAFLPLMLLPGVVGDFMRIIPIVVTLALGASLFECFFILPAHISEWTPKKAATPVIRFDAVRKKYRMLLAKAIRRRYIVLPATMLFMLSTAVPIIALMGVDMFADEEIPLFYGYITMPEGTNLETTDRIIKQVETRAREALAPSDLKNVVGTSGFQERESEWIVKKSVGQVLIELEDNDVRQFDVTTNMNMLRKSVENIPGIESMEFHRLSSGPPTGAPIEAKVRGEHLDELIAASDELKAYLGSIDGVTDIRDDFLEGVLELRVRVDEERAAMLGLTVAEVAGVVNTAFSGAVATQFLDGDDDIDVIVRLEERSRTNRRDLTGLRISLPGGGRIPLKDIAHIEEAIGYTTIKRDDNERAIIVSASVDPNVISGVEASQMVRDHWPVIAAHHPGYSLKFGGQFEEFQKAFKNLGLLFLVGIAIMLALLSAQFNSVLQPLIIFSAVVFALWGAIIGLFVIGSVFSINNLFGLVALSGVAVNNSIVMISFVNTLREKGHNRLRAVMEAGQLRVRPILLTSLTTIVGLVPMALGLGGYSEVWGPLAVIMVCGLGASSLLTLFMVPILYLNTGDFRRLALGFLGKTENKAATRKRWKKRRQRRTGVPAPDPA